MTMTEPRIGEISASSEISPPAWATADAADVAYYLLINTVNATKNRPTIRLTGTHGTSLPMLLTVYGDSSDADKGPNAALTHGRRGFWLDGLRVGNVGLPYDVNLVAGGEDGWAFDRIDLLVFTKKPEADWTSLKKMLPQGADATIDISSMSWVEHGDALAVPPEHLTFRHRRCLSSKREVAGSDIYVPEVTVTADKWGGWEDADWVSELVPIETEITITDNRWSTESIPRSVEYTETVSNEALRRALSIRERSTTKTVGVTIGVEKTSEASAQVPVEGATLGAKSGWKASGTFKFSRVSTSLERTESETQETHASRTSEAQRLEYAVPPGCVTFFSVIKRARIEGLPDSFHGASIVRTDEGLIETLVERHDFRMNAETKQLQDYGPVYSPKGQATNRWGLAIDDYPEFAQAIRTKERKP